MHADSSVSVVIPAFDEQATIDDVVRDFLAHPAVDEVLVVDNCSQDETADRARAAGARVIEEASQGYGCAIRAGLRAASGETLVVVEADGSFRSDDLPKLLEYLAPDTLVMGSRTNRALVQPGAYMRLPIRWGNVAMAKLLQVLWMIPSRPRLTDVGCTYRALHRATWQRLEPGLREHGPAFSIEMMVQALRRGLRLVEVPVHYYPRAGGSSKHLGRYTGAASIALQMLRVLATRRLGF